MLLANMPAGQSTHYLNLWTSTHDLCLKGNSHINKSLLNVNNIPRKYKILYKIFGDIV